MPRFIFALGWLLLASAAVLLITGPWLPMPVVDALKNAVPAGLLVALAGNLLTQSKNAADAAEKRSSFYLDSAKKAYERAQTLLADGKSHRVLWTEAGRCLGHAKALAEGVTLESHHRVLELYRLEYRSFFHDLLASKSASFFYGVSGAQTLDDAARASTAPEERDGRATTSTLSELDEASIRAIWEVAQWPKNYQDPLGTRFTDAEIGRLLVLFPQLHNHIEHRRRWHSASGQLFPRRGDS
jgi:hypothetical protein